MFKRLLIANRGEIAVRIIRACQELNIETVAVYSDIDKNSLHTRLADFSCRLGTDEAKDSYLNKSAIIAAAKAAKAEAIHPGYGFLAEDGEFAQMVLDNGLVFIGPSPDVIRQAGNKDQTREAMKRAGLIMPKASPLITCADDAALYAKDIGYPVILKPAAGGGGRGMYVAFSQKELIGAIAKYKKSSLANCLFYFEKYFVGSRHIEVQIVADNFGQIVHLGERECSLQRRNQKILEEAPSSALTENARQNVGELAVWAAKSLHYANIGTVEFLMDNSGNFHFMEINPRIQVEHGITEVITGLDLVKTQIQLAAGQPLSIVQKDVTFSGHAIECRINAEDASRNFLPSPGKITFYHPPGGANVRVDSGVCAGHIVTPYYDSLIAKVIAYGKTRGEAITTMKRALNEFRIEGIKTTIDFHKKVINNPQFRLGNIDTQFVSNYLVS